MLSAKNGADGRRIGPQNTSTREVRQERERRTSAALDVCSSILLNGFRH